MGIGEERTKKLLWLSDVPYPTNHRKAREGLGDESGLWLFEKQEFIDWKKSQSSSASALLLYGSGK